MSNVHIKKLTKLGLFNNKQEIKRSIGRYLDRYPLIEDYVVQNTQFLPTGTIFKARVHCLKNNFTTAPVCGGCGADVAFHSMGYNKYCSCACRKLCNSITQDKRIKTNIKIYGTQSAAQSQQVKDNVVKANMVKHGVGCTKQKHLVNNGTLDKLQSYEYMYNEHYNLKKSPMVISYELQVSPITVRSYLKSHNIAIKFYNTSNEQIQVDNYIKSIYSGEILYNNRKILYKRELDVYLPDLKIAFEYNGLYWHSESSGMDNNYHLDKLNLCNETGIALYQIWSCEWEQKQDIVKSYINSILKQTININANDCDIHQLTIDETEDFFSNNHISGYQPANTAYGLFLNNELVYGLSITGNTIIQHSNILNTNVINGLSMLLHIIKQHTLNTIIAYTDSRWDHGELYEQTGFAFVENITPSYYYFNLNKNKYLISKNEIDTLASTWDTNITEWENMKNNGYNRVWDCGSTIWELKI